MAVAGGTLADRIALAINERITAGTWPVGTRLPGERELARDFETSRVTLRQALRTLETRGIVEVQGRSGAYVRAPSMGQVSDALQRFIAFGARPVTIRDLLEVRQLEIDVAGYAAERRTQDDLREIASALADGAISLGAVVAEAPPPEAIAAWARTDVAFHAAIARATHNPLYTIIYDALGTVFFEQRLRTVSVLPGTRPHSFRHHQRVFECIATADAEGARGAMRAHLDEACETLLRYSEMDRTLATGERVGG